MKKSLYLASMLLVVASCTIQKYSHDELIEASNTMPQIIYENIEVMHLDWSEEQIAEYYLDRKDELLEQFKGLE